MGLNPWYLVTGYLKDITVVFIICAYDGIY